MTVQDWFGGWDARYFWSLKAKFFFRDPAEWKSMFHPALAWSHTDYPLLIPGAWAWGWNTLKAETLAWPAIVDYVFVSSMVLLVLWYVGSFISVWGGMLAGAFLLNLPALQFWSTGHCADIPLSFYMSASALLLIMGLRIRRKESLLLCGFLAGLAAWTKNEGGFFLMIMGACLVLTQLLDRKAKFRERVFSLVYFGLGVALPFLCTFYLKFFLDHAGNEFINTHREPADFLHLMTDGKRLQHLGGVYWSLATSITIWNALWLLFLGGLVLGARRVVRSDIWIPAFMVLAVHIIYFCVILITPYDFELQISTTIARLPLHITPLALVFVFEVFGRLPGPPEAQPQEGKAFR